MGRPGSGRRRGAGRGPGHQHVDGTGTGPSRGGVGRPAAKGGRACGIFVFDDGNLGERPGGKASSKARRFFVAGDIADVYSGPQVVEILALIWFSWTMPIRGTLTIGSRKTSSSLGA